MTNPPKSGWSLAKDPAEFAAGEEFLLARAATNFPLLTALSTYRHTGDGRTRLEFGLWIEPGGAVGGAFVSTPFGPLQLGDMPVEAAVALPGWLGDALHAWEGRSDLAEAVASACPATPIGHRLGLHRLKALRPSPVPGGSARPATPADHDLLNRWYEAVTRGHGTLGAVAGRLAAGDLYVWETGGRVVAVAGRGPRFGSTVRVHPIYTESAYREHGYATALVAAVTRTLLEAGFTEVVHVTTPASQATYQRLGYRHLADHVTFERRRSHAADAGSAAPRAGAQEPVGDQEA